MPFYSPSERGSIEITRLFKGRSPDQLGGVKIGDRCHAKSDSPASDTPNKFSVAAGSDPGAAKSLLDRATAAIMSFANQSIFQFALRSAFWRLCNSYTSRLFLGFWLAERKNIDFVLLH